MPSERGWRRQVTALAVLLVVALLRWHTALLDPQLAVDERDYTDAFARLRAGGNPYDAPRFLYPPPFAAAGAAAAGAFDTPSGDGALRVVKALRLANLCGAVALVWTSLGWSTLAWSRRLAIGCLLLVAWAPIRQAIDYGNVSLAVIGLTLGAVALLPRRAIAAGALLGAGIAVKPVAPVLVALLPAWRPPRGPRPDTRRTLAGGIAAAAAGLALAGCLLWRRDLLPRMLTQTTRELATEHTLSLWRLLHCVGIDVAPWMLFLAVLAVSAPLLWMRRRETAELAALAGAAALSATPLVWTHTLALSLPGQVLALDRAAAAWRSSAPQGRRRALLLLLALAALALAVQASAALVAVSERPLLAQVPYLLPPVAAPVVFAAVALARRRHGG